MGFDPASESVGLQDCHWASDGGNVLMQHLLHDKYSGVTGHCGCQNLALWSLVTGMVSLCGCGVPRTGSHPWSL